MGEMTVEIQIEEGEPLGATPNDKLVIVKVQKETPADGKLKIGDRIVKLNNWKLEDTNDFYNKLRFAHPVASVTIVRDEAKAAELEAKFHIPEERAKFVQRRDGYTYMLVNIIWQRGGPKLGLGIKHYQNRVLVSRCDPGSLAAQNLLLGDHVCDIDAKPVTDKDVARELLIKGLQSRGQVSMVVERPESMEAKHWVQTALSASAAQPPSVIMNSDARDIAAKERDRLKQRAGAKPASILSKSQSGASRKVQFAEDEKSLQREHVIGADVPDMSKLRRVRK